jgi:hypothetical protein
MDQSSRLQDAMDLAHRLPGVADVFQRAGAEDTVEGVVGERHTVDVAHDVYLGDRHRIQSHDTGSDASSPRANIQNTGAGRQHAKGARNLIAGNDRRVRQESQDTG